ncbi:MAG: hypothetical protein WC647_15610 [Desulfomonilaceae bacterium]|jgi:hypothetical protein
MAGENDKKGKTQKENEPQASQEPTETDNLTSIVQSDDSELPQSVKDKFKD